MLYFLLALGAANGGMHLVASVKKLLNYMGGDKPAGTRDERIYCCDVLLFRSAAPTDRTFGRGQLLGVISHRGTHTQSHLAHIPAGIRTRLLKISLV